MLNSCKHAVLSAIWLQPELQLSDATVPSVCCTTFDFNVVQQMERSNLATQIKPIIERFSLVSSGALGYLSLFR